MSEALSSWEEPDWLSDPRYADALTASEQLACLAASGPAGRDLGVLSAIELPQLSRGERIELLSVLEQQKRWIEAQQVTVLATIDATDASKEHYSEESVSLALQLPLATAQNKLKQAATLQRELPATLAALRAGEISSDHGRVVAEALWKLPAGSAAELEEAVLSAAPLQTPPQFRNTVRRAAVRIDPATAEERHQRALADRKVGCQPADDGMVLLPVLLGAAEGQLIFTRLTTAARLLPAQDPRTMDQRRADLLVDAVLAGFGDGGGLGGLGGLDEGELPVPRGRKPTINVVVSADTLLQLDDEPAHLTGYGPITAEAARRLAADESGTWRRLLTDPDTGALLDISADTYRPPRRLRRFIEARDDVCAFPTCNQPGYRCEYEHIVPFLQGGRTCRCNGALACRRHNNCKVDTGWNYTYNSDGSFTWTTAEGKQYTSAPALIWPSPLDSRPRGPATSPPTVALVWAQEDKEYRQLLAKWQALLDQAERDEDGEAIARLTETLRACQLDRDRQLAHRADPEQPPY
jgi:hypothetical protein